MRAVAARQHVPSDAVVAGRGLVASYLTEMDSSASQRVLIQRVLIAVEKHLESGCSRLVRPYMDDTGGLGHL